MASDWAKLGIAAGGAILGGWAIPGYIGVMAGWMAGSYVGSLIFPTNYESEMPTLHDYPIQTSAAGIPVAIVYGTVELCGNIIHKGELVSYQIKHSAGGGKGGGEEQVTYETRYRRSFLISICEGPATIRKAWKGKNEISLSDFTQYNGAGNSGISTLIGENYAEYSNLCLAYFEDYELGNTPRIPNIVFEVSSGVLSFDHLICGGASWEDQGNGIFCSWHYDNDGVLLKELQDYSVPNILAISPDSAVDPNDSSFYCTYIAEQKGVWKFDKEGELRTSWGIDGKLIFPAGSHARSCAVDSSGNLYVGLYHHPAEAALDVLHKYDSSGNLIWSAQPSLLTETRWVSRIIIHSDGYGYLVEYDSTNPPNWNAWKFSLSDGSFLQEYIPSGGSLRAHGIDVDDFGFVYILTSWANIERFANDGTWTHTVALDEAYPIDALAEGLVVKSGDDASETIVYACGYKQNATSGLNENNIWKYDWDFGNLLATKLFDSAYSAFATRLSQDEDNKILVIYGTGGEPRNIYQLDCSDLSITKTWTISGYKGFQHATRHSLIPEEAYDMNFASMIKDLLINDRFGNYEAADLITEDFDSIIAYCEANNLKGSIKITKQKSLPDWIQYICAHFQGYTYDLGGKIGLNCYRNQSSVMSLTRNDLFVEEKESPVHITKRAPSSTVNRLECAWTDRANNYSTAVVPAFDRIDQREAGQVRTKLLDLKAITDSELASKMAWRIFIDQIYRFSQYNFTLGYKSMLLEVGDVIDVTDGFLLTAQKMRVMLVEEEKDGRRAMIHAVEDIAHLYPAISYAVQESEAVPDADIVLEDGTVAFREQWDDNKLHLSITPGGAQCNGWYIYKSYDDVSYSLAGRAAIETVTGGGANSTGTFQSNLPAHPAVVHRQAEAFDVSIGTLTDLDTAVTDDNFFNKRKLAKIGNEIIAYKTCVESAVEGTWRVSNLIRGLFGTEAVAHVPGEDFRTLDIDFIYVLQAGDIGKTLYFKVVTYYANKIQLLSEVTSQDHDVLGWWKRPAPVSLMRIHYREGLSTYKTADVIIDFYFCSKVSGFGSGGYGNALWGAYTKDPLLERLKVELEEEDGTPITDSNYELDAYGEPAQLEILEADRNGKNPIVVKLSPMSNLLGNSREITIEKI